MPRFLMRLQFRGTNYFGWQRQNDDQPSVQGAVEAAVQSLATELNPESKPISVYGASRTDRGVHARDMAAQTDLDTRLRGEDLRRAIDVRLPEDIALLEITEVPADFNCRHLSLGKCYAYRIYNSRRRPALLADRIFHEPRELDPRAMRAAAKTLVGTHDFTSFGTLLSEHEGGLTSKPDPSNPLKPDGNIRTIHSIAVINRGERLAVLVFGDGFLRGMVRGIVGTLIETGLGKRQPADVKRILEARTRKAAGQNLPGWGLTLERVFFTPEERSAWIEAATAAERGGDDRLSLLEGAPLELLP